MSKGYNFNYVELFSGCGGMSLGLESAGFTRLLANEISPMAAETFAYNLVEGARNHALMINPKEPGSWDDYFNFLTDSPAEDGVMLDEKSYRDWRTHRSPDRKLDGKLKEVLTEGLKPNLIVGDVSKLADILERLERDSNHNLWKGFRNLHVLAGGPPCQSFSLAGKRQRDHPRNKLFLSFVRIASVLQPKVVLFENVVGITKSFQDEEGKEWHPWFEVCRAFRKKGYIPIPSLVNASCFGVPQARPRFIIVGLREDVANNLKRDVGGTLADAIDLGGRSYGIRTRWKDGDDRKLIYRHESKVDRKSWPSMLFPSPMDDDDKKICVNDAIRDLIGVDTGNSFDQGAYSAELDRLLKRPVWLPAPKGIKNHSPRNHGDRTRARFRLLRVLASRGFRAKSMIEVIKKRERAVSLLAGERLYLPDGKGGYGQLRKAKKSNINELLDSLTSAKHAQRVLDGSRPAPAQLSIPDDFIHWAEDRVLTIREMARIQSFPDWFEFRSKETTGGSSRAFEVPQYTQVGNAVPPLLARSFGVAIKKALALSENVRFPEIID